MMSKSHEEWGQEYNLKYSRARLDEMYADWTEERKDLKAEVADQKWAAEGNLKTCGKLGRQVRQLQAEIKELEKRVHLLDE